MSLIGITNFALSVVPSEDAHGSEYVAVHDKRRTCKLDWGRLLHRGAATY